MAWTGEAPDTTMRTSSIRIDRLREPDIRRVMPRDHALRVLDRDHRLGLALLPFGRILEPAVIDRLAIVDLEAALGIDRRAAALGDFAMVAGGGLEGHRAILRGLGHGGMSDNALGIS